jgi:hypothetical protein
MPFTSRGREYSNIEVGLATGMIRPGSGRLRKLRRTLAGEAVRASKKRKQQAQRPSAPPRRPVAAPVKSPIERERQRRRLTRMGLLKK